MIDTIVQHWYCLGLQY